MTLKLVLGLYAIALVETLVRRPSRTARTETDKDEKESGALLLLRPLVPTYRFFDSIGERVWLGARRHGTDSPFLLLPEAPRRRLWFLVENWRENLWLWDQGKLATHARQLSEENPEEVAKSRALLIRRAASALNALPTSRGHSYDCALLVGNGNEQRIVEQFQVDATHFETHRGREL